VYSLPNPTSYLHLIPESGLPEISAAPTKCIVVVEAVVSYQWQKHVCEWMLASGCLYMMGWGHDCNAWDDAMDWANIDKYDGHEIPENQFIVTTWHDGESLEEVFWFSKSVAEHTCVELVRTIILHISAADRKDELLELYACA
jgi:hypothetical protein